MIICILDLTRTTSALVEIFLEDVIFYQMDRVTMAVHICLDKEIHDTTGKKGNIKYHMIDCELFIYLY